LVAIKFCKGEGAGSGCPSTAELSADQWQLMQAVAGLLWRRLEAVPDRGRSTDSIMILLKRCEAGPRDSLTIEEEGIREERGRGAGEGTPRGGRGQGLGGHLAIGGGDGRGEQGDGGYQGGRGGYQGGGGGDSGKGGHGGGPWSGRVEGAG
jgi:hypothetical protein